MSPSSKGVAVVVGAALAAVVVLAWLMLSGPARAHEMFKDLFDPVTKKGCCNDGDCKVVPQEWVDAGAVTPHFGGYRVQLTLEQAKFFNPNVNQPVDALFPAERVIWGLPHQWAICLNPTDESAMPPYSGHRVRCLIGLGQS